MTHTLLPSGESNFYDYAQDRHLHDGSGINAFFPMPSGAESGLLRTYASSAQVPNVYDSGILNFRDAISQFSNASGIDSEAFDFELLNPYIHYYRQDNQVVRIPFISTYRVSVVYNPYRRIR